MICAFAPCTCAVDADGDLCAPTCRMGLGDAAEPCKCGHAECRATQGRG